MRIDKHILLLIVAISLSVLSRNFFVAHYRREMCIDVAASRDLLQQRAGAYLQKNLHPPEEHDSTESEKSESSEQHNKHHDEKSPPHDENCDCGHDHTHEHVHAPEKSEEGHKHAHTHITDTNLPKHDLDLARQDEAPAVQSFCTNPNCKEHHHEHHGEHQHEIKDPDVSPGLVILLRELGFAELAANLLWIQMDADSHRGLWHRVEVALELIPALDPTFIDAYLLRSFLLDEYLKRHDEALLILENAAKEVPNRIELWQQIGIFCLNHSGRHGPKRRLEKALEAFRTMLKFPDQDQPPQTVRLVAVTLAAMERRDEAIELLSSSSKDEKRPVDQRRIDRQMIERIQSQEKF